MKKFLLLSSMAIFAICLNMNAAPPITAKAKVVAITTAPNIIQKTYANWIDPAITLAPNDQTAANTFTTATMKGSKVNNVSANKFNGANTSNATKNDPARKNKIKAWQRANNLVPDGIYGAKCKAQMKANIAAKKKAVAINNAIPNNTRANNFATVMDTGQNANTIVDTNFADNISMADQVPLAA